MSHTPVSSSGYTDGGSDPRRGYTSMPAHGMSSNAQAYPQYGTTEGQPRHSSSHTSSVGYHVHGSGAAASRYGHPPSIGAATSGAPPPLLPALPPLSSPSASAYPPHAHHHRPAHQAFLPPLRGQPQALARGIPDSSPQEVLASLSLHQHQDYLQHQQQHHQLQHPLHPQHHLHQHQQLQPRHPYPYQQQPQYQQHQGATYLYDPASTPEEGHHSRGRSAGSSSNGSHHHSHSHHRQTLPSQNYSMASVANGGNAPLPHQQQHHQDDASPSPTASPGGDRDRKSSPPRSRLTEQEKKNNHIASEQKRRNAIRDGFDRLTELIPGCEGQGRSEGMVLGKSIEYINDCLEERKKLIERIEQLGGVVPPELRKYT
ncbi:hypothetical protein DFH27DRAFT_101755 [Peziza echinospora]|nr:hypothetical protein DFH27DRAFT_101755 [Peziza echinospora]